MESYRPSDFGENKDAEKEKSEVPRQMEYVHRTDMQDKPLPNSEVKKEAKTDTAAAIAIERKELSVSSSSVGSGNIQDTPQDTQPASTVQNETNDAQIEQYRQEVEAHDEKRLAEIRAMLSKPIRDRDG